MCSEETPEIEHCLLPESARLSDRYLCVLERRIAWVVTDLPIEKSQSLCRYRLLIGDNQKRILVDARNSKVRLPTWLTGRGHPLQATDHINKWTLSRTGVRAITLRCISTGPSPDGESIERRYELAALRPVDPAEGFLWISRDEVPELATPSERNLAETHFSDFASPPAARRPWARPGWWETAAAWIQQQLQVAGHRGEPKITQISSWERGCVLRVVSPAATLYFKALPLQLAHELGVLRSLAMENPSLVPKLVAADEDCRWILTEKMPGRALSVRDDVDQWRTACSVLAKLQVGSIATAELFRADLPSRGVDWMLNKLAADPFRRADISPEFRAQLGARLTGLRSQARRLAALSLPSAIEHGDLIPSNIFIHAGNAVIFDWTDASVSIPFFSLWSLLDAIGTDVAHLGTKTARKALVDAYFRKWNKLASDATLSEAWRLTQRLAPLHLALRYQFDILPAVESRWEMENMVPYFLHKLA